MSVFDPYTLYKRTYKKTHKGQIIQQKPTHVHSPIIKSEIPRSLSVLKTFNYTIFPNDTSIFPQTLNIPMSTLYAEVRQAPSGETISYIDYSSVFAMLRQLYPPYLTSIGINANNYADLIESVELYVDFNDLEVFFSPGRAQNIISIGFENIPNGWSCNTGTAIGSGAQQATCFFVAKVSGLQMFCYPRQTTGEVIINIDTLEQMTSSIDFKLEGLDILQYIFASSGSPQTGDIFTGFMSHNNGTGGSSTIYASVDFNLSILPKSQNL